MYLYTYVIMYYTGVKNKTILLNILQVFFYFTHISQGF